MKWFLLFLGFCVLVGMTTQVNNGGTSSAPVAYKPPPPGLVVSQEAALKYLRLMIVSNGQRCRRIQSARLWAISEGGSYTQVGCDVLSNGKGLWYGVHTNDKGKLTSIDTARTTAIFPQ